MTEEEWEAYTKEKSDYFKAWDAWREDQRKAAAWESGINANEALPSILRQAQAGKIQEGVQPKDPYAAEELMDTGREQPPEPDFSTTPLNPSKTPRLYKRAREMGATLHTDPVAGVTSIAKKPRANPPMNPAAGKDRAIGTNSMSKGHIEEGAQSNIQEGAIDPNWKFNGPYDSPPMNIAPEHIQLEELWHRGAHPSGSGPRVSSLWSGRTSKGFQHFFKYSAGGKKSMGEEGRWRKISMGAWGKHVKKKLESRKDYRLFLPQHLPNNLKTLRDFQRASRGGNRQGRIYATMLKGQRDYLEEMRRLRTGVLGGADMQHFLWTLRQEPSSSEGASSSPGESMGSIIRRVDDPRYAGANVLIPRSKKKKGKEEEVPEEEQEMSDID